jgi:hypothetical protein
MRSIRVILSEIIGLFVDDGSLAAALLVWCAVVAGVRAVLPGSPLLAGGLLAGGCVAILLVNIRRTAAGVSRPPSARPSPGA